nr:hypothetical protein [Tanacetum cinerariifolium]
DKYVKSYRAVGFKAKSFNLVTKVAMKQGASLLRSYSSLVMVRWNDKNKEGLRYTIVPPPIGQLYISPKKDLSWTGLPECADDTVTDYSMPSPTVESTSEDGQNRNSFSSKNREPIDSILSKPTVKFIKAVDRPAERPTTNKAETAHSYSKRTFQETTQELMIISIQTVQRLERELKARDPIYKVDKGKSRPVMAWVPKRD